MIFNERLPDEPNSKTAAAPAAAPAAADSPAATPSEFGPKAGMTALVDAVAPGWKFDMLVIISSAYVITYFVAGGAAIAVWIRASSSTPDLIKNLALISIGLFVAIARGFFNVPNP